MTKVTTNGTVWTRTFTLPLMAATAAMALVAASAPAQAKPPANPELSRPLMSNEAGLVIRIKASDKPEVRQTSQRGKQTARKSTGKNSGYGKNQAGYARNGHGTAKMGNKSGFDRNDVYRDARFRYGKGNYFTPVRGWKTPKSWLAVRGEIVSVGRGRYANTFTVVRDGIYKGRPALVSVQYRDPRHGAPQMVPSSKRLIRYTWSTWNR